MSVRRLERAGFDHELSGTEVDVALDGDGGVVQVLEPRRGGAGEGAARDTERNVGELEARVEQHVERRDRRPGGRDA